MGKTTRTKSLRSPMDKLKQFQKKFNQMRDGTGRWEDLQSRFVAQFSSASSIILRLPVLRDSNNLGALGNHENFRDKLIAKQMESLQKIMVSMKQTLDEFGRLVESFEKMVRDSRESIQKESNLEQRIGVYSSLGYCMEKLETLCDMHRSEYRLKSSLFDGLSQLTFEPNADDLSSLRQILVDQPNIPREKVDDIFDYLTFPPKL